ncbi:MAG TPA: hypothetical protein VE964_08835, partial [Myxococcales bacterium]|nr:hypothetical protein [Myxococcales bacterium]
LLELSLGFMVLSPVPGALDVSVVEPVWVESTGPVEGAAGDAGRAWSPLAPELVSLLGMLLSEERCIEPSALRPLARRFDDFIAPCLLQSHLQSLSFAMLSDELATSRLDADDELDMEPRSEVLPVEVPALGIDWAGMSFLVVLVDGLLRSSVVCALAAGAASASARMEVATSFIGASVS